MHVNCCLTVLVKEVGFECIESVRDFLIVELKHSSEDMTSARHRQESNEEICPNKVI